MKTLKFAFLEDFHIRDANVKVWVFVFAYVCFRYFLNLKRPLSAQLQLLFVLDLL